jgi:hypothetical protein
MAGEHGASGAGDFMDMPEHDSTYAAFVAITEISIVALLCILLELVLWGLKGQGLLALIGFVLTCGAAAFGGVSGLNWRAVLPIFVLLGLACIVF